MADLIGYGSTILSAEDVMPGVPEMVPLLQVEGCFPDGTKLVTVHDPIRPSANFIALDPPETESVEPGEIIAGDGDIELNVGRRRASLSALNTGDRPIQIGSHYHFFEANRALEFNREASFGMHLDIPAGTAVRFEPGESKQVSLVAFGGTGEVFGLNALTNGATRLDRTREASLQRAKQRGFKGA